MYAIGTIKVAWVESDPEYFSSQMFAPDQLDEAIEFGERVKDYMIMQLIKTDGDYYRWRLLKYGGYKQLISGTKVKRKLQKIFGSESGYNSIESSFTEEEKNTQMIRLIDVFLIGPLLIYTSFQKSLPNWLRVSLLVIGVSTILYNGNNYVKSKQK
jgi:hypothetical protein